MTNEWLVSLNNFYCVFMLLIYPLIIRNAYYDVAKAKLVAFYTISFIYIAASLLIYAFLKYKKTFKPQSIFTHTEKILLIIISSSALLTFLINGNYENTFLGVYDYASGLLFIVTIIISFVFLYISGIDEKIFCICGTVSLIVTSILTIMQYTNVNIPTIPIFDGSGFFATIGNRDLIGFYFVIMIPFAVFLISQKRYFLLGYLGIFLGTIGIVVSNTDVAVIGFIIEAALIFILTLKRIDNTKIPYLFTLVVGFGLLASYLLRICFTNTLEIALVEMIFSSPAISIPLIIISVGGLFFYNTRYYNIILRVCAIIVLIIFALYPVYIIIFTICASSSNTSPLRHGLYFDNHWGSGRGYIWKTTVYLFKNSNLLNMLLGHGAISYYNDYTANEALFHEMFEPMYVGMNLTTSHNVFLHFLYEYGIIGLISVLSLIYYQLKRMITNESLFYNMKFVALIGALVTGAFLMSYNINMAFIPVLLI